MWDLRLKNPFNMLICGASQSGKSTLVMNMIRHVEDIFQDPRCKDNVILYYKEDQAIYKSAKEEGFIHQMVNQKPTVRDIKDRTLASKERGSIVIIDDFQTELTADMIEIFSVTGHHYNTSILLLVHNLFQPGKIFRTISLNTQYILLFKSPRDNSQINSIAHQLSPGNTKYIIEGYYEATKRPHSYFLMDNHQLTPDFLRYRTNIVPNGYPMTVYMKK